MEEENEIIEIKPRRKRRSLEQIDELVREFEASGLTQRQFCEEGGIGLSELQRSLKIVRRESSHSSKPKLMAVEVAAERQNSGALDLLVGEAYRIRIGAGVCAVTLRRLLELL